MRSSHSSKRKFVSGTNFKYTFETRDFECKGAEYHQIFVWKDYGGFYGPRLAGNGECSSSEKAWQELLVAKALQGISSSNNAS
jgi:hypothetical protein